MKIANADKLKKHFENVVDVKLFTVPEICTIIDTFSTEVPDNDPISRGEIYRKVKTECNPYGAPTIDYEGGNKLLGYIDRMPDVFGGTRP